jgi:hypothetical protein
MTTKQWKCACGFEAETSAVYDEKVCPKCYSKMQNTPALPPPELLHVERDGAEVYITASGGLERLCTMSRPGESQRLADARTIVWAVNSQAKSNKQAARIDVARGYLLAGRPDLAAMALTDEPVESNEV